jgi:NADH-quinone oxidoreductase subunit L
MLLAVLVAFGGGAGIAYWMYVKEKGRPAAELAEKWPRLHSFLQDKWRVDEFYEETIIGAVDSLADMCVWADRWIVDGILARFTAGVAQVTGTVLRQFQTGRTHAYAAAMTVGILGVAVYFWAPHASVRESIDHAQGKYALAAAPGLGYSYRFDVDGQEGWDEEEFSGNTDAEFSLDVAEERTVRVQVKNAFGVTSEEEFTYVRPKPDASRPSGGRFIQVDEDGKPHLRDRKTVDKKIQGPPPGARPRRPVDQEGGH